MKMPPRLLGWLARGVVGAGIFAWLIIPRRSEETTPAMGKISVGKARPTPTSVTAYIDSNSLTKGTVAPPARRRNAEVHALVHEKLKQWFATETGDTETQDELTNELLGLLTDDNLAATVQSLSPQELGSPFGIKATERWLALNKMEAANWLAAQPGATEEQAHLVAHALLGDLRELRDYTARLPESAWKQQLLNHAGLEILSIDPVAAIELAQHLSSPEARTNVLETVAYDWFARDLDAATNWIKSVPDAILRERLFAIGAKSIAVSDPDLAAGWLAAAVKSEGILNETVSSVIEAWADRRPDEAAKWVARFSDAGSRKVSIDLLLTHWLRSDPVAANAWIQTLPESESILTTLKAAQAEREKGPGSE